MADFSFYFVFLSYTQFLVEFPVSYSFLLTFSNIFDRDGVEGCAIDL